jgi:Domain of unknown function (DUF4249)
MSVILLCLASACEIEKVSIPQTEPRIAMHGVLSPTASTQVVLLERTRSGSVAMIAPPFDVADPVVSDEGIAESDAIVTLTTPGGQTLFGVEDNRVRDDHKGAGIYRFALPGGALERNATYRLSVHTTAGRILAAETSVPAGVTATVAEQRDFDRARDTVVIEWPAAAGARSYFVRIETPFGPRVFFTDTTRVRIPGDLRNVDAVALPRVFIPGFQQAITVSAVDANYYDWYRSHNNAFSGTGVVNRVEGGMGFFGSLVRLNFQDFRVTSPQTEPAAGTFRFVGSPAEEISTPFSSLELYVESRAARGDQGDALSGRYQIRSGLMYRCDGVNGLLGTVRNGRIELAFHCRWSATDTVDVLSGEMRGDTIVGGYRFFGGPVHFVKQR